MDETNVARNWTCPEHGVSYGENIPTGRMTWECPDCVKAAEQAEATWDRLWRRYRYWEKSSNIPFRFRNRTLKNWERIGKANEAIGAAFDRYALNLADNVQNGKGAVLLGPPGLGKTHLLTAIVAHAISMGQTANYFVWPDVLTEIKNGFGKPREELRRDLMAQLQAVDLLALDELALKSSATEFETGQLFELIDLRYREQRPTLVASNATGSTFASVVGERIADRLTECSPVIVFSGQSRRSVQGRETGQADDRGWSEYQLQFPPETLETRIHSMGKWSERLKDRETGRLR